MSYNKRVWANGDLITKESINNIEDGIFDAHDKINAINNKVEENTTDTNTARQDISDIKSQIGTEELTTTSKKIKGAINDLSSQIKDFENSKADKSTTTDMQTQINNLVLGAVGDGNNAEVVQARGVFNLLNNRINAIETHPSYQDVVGLMIKKEDGLVFMPTPEKDEPGVTYSEYHRALYFPIKPYTTYYIKKNATSRFRIALTKKPVNLIDTTDAYNPDLSIAVQSKVIFNDNSATETAFYSEDYNYAVVYYHNGKNGSPLTSLSIIEKTVNTTDLINNISNNLESISGNIQKELANPALFEQGTIDYTSGNLMDDSTKIRTKDFLSSDITAMEMFNSNYVVGVRIYDKSNNYLKSQGNMKVYTFNHDEYNYKLILISNSEDITPDVASNFRFTKKDGLCLVKQQQPINANWNMWDDVRYYYGFDKTIQPIYNTIYGVLESDTMISVRGGKGRWNKTDNPSSEFVSGGHVFEGWSGNELCRLTMLMGKFHETFACIQTYSPAGLYETNRRFGWVKLGSDEKNKGADFSQFNSIFYTPLTLQNRDSDPSSVPDYDLNPQLTSNSIPIGTMYYNTNLQKVRVYTSNGWKSIAFE